MKAVAQILKSKPDLIYSISPEATVFDAVRMLAEKGIGALPVMEGSRLVGIISERDYARKVVLQNRSSKDTKVREIMTTRVYVVKPAQTSEECMALMTQNRIRHLPVMDGDKLIGVVSIGDLVREIIAEQAYTIKQLESFIYG